MARLLIFILTNIVSTLLLAGVDTPPTPFMPASVRDTIIQRTVGITLVDSNGQVSACSGFLVSPTQVFTAGHCVVPGRAYHSVRVRIFERSTGRYREIEVTEINNRYRDHYDASIYTLEETQSRLVSEGSQSIPILEDVQSCDRERPFYAAGFGLNNQNQTGQLNIAQYRPMTSAESELRNSVYPTRGQSFALAGERGRICGGDSGGPVLCYARGALSLVGTIAGVGFTNASVMSEAPNAQGCRARDFLEVAEISQHREIEESIRRSALPVAESPESDSSQL